MVLPFQEQSRDLKECIDRNLDSLEEFKLALFGISESFAL